MAEGSALTVRTLDAGDHARVLDIYNHYVEHSPATFDVHPFNMAQRIPWFAQFEQDPFHCVVAVHQERVVGYACSTSFKSKPAYRTSVECSVYTDPAHQAKGVGTAMYEVLLSYLSEQEVHRAYAGIALPNDASVAVHKKFGFQQAGHFREVGYKFDQYWDVLWMERAFP